MSEFRINVALSKIREVVQQIASRFHPEKVVLFGSHVYGHLVNDSDVDLLVVMETDENPLHTAARISALIDHPFLLNIVVYRPLELEASLKRQGSFTTEVITKGIVLYKS